MEYELYAYCTRMGCLGIFLICLYHVLPESTQEKNNTQRQLSNVLHIDVFSYGNIFFTDTSQMGIIFFLIMILN